MSSDGLLARAYGYAACAHRRQKRKYTGDPYIVHPVAVATTLARVGLPDFVQVAALLHDTIEDCGVTYEEIGAEFGTNVATLVYQVTDAFTKELYPHWNRDKRKSLERDRLSRVSAYAQSIKVADLIDNTVSIVKHDPGFAKLYLSEKRALLKVLTEANTLLLDIAREQLERLSDQVA